MKVLIGIISILILISITYYLYPKLYKSMYIYSMFFLYDIFTFGGNSWKFDKAHCSYMKNGFETPLPLTFYERFNEAISPRIESGNNTLQSEEVKNICDEMLEYLETNNIPYAEKQSLPVLHIDDKGAVEQIRQYVNDNVPFVIRGVQLDVFNNMKFQTILRMFKNDKVLFSPSEPYCEEQVIEEFGKILENKCYVSNVTNVFEKYGNALLTKEDEDKLSKINGGKLDTKQMFVGVTQGSGTKMHNAFSNNFFINIEGRKTWTFFNPNNSPLVYPFFSESGVYNASESRFSKHGISDISKFPLLKYCPYYQYTVEPGEILYNPASWWHAIYNETQITVAVSTRWVFPDFYTKMTDYHLLRCGNLRNPKLRDLVEKLYIEYGVLGVAVIDEHNILGNSEETSQLPVWDSITNESHNKCAKEKCELHWHKAK